MTFPMWLIPPQKIKPLKSRIPLRVRVDGRVYPSAEFAALRLGIDKAVVRQRIYRGTAEYIK